MSLTHFHVLTRVSLPLTPETFDLFRALVTYLPSLSSVEAVYRQGFPASASSAG